MDIDLRNVRLPNKMNINYEEHISKEEADSRAQR